MRRSTRATSGASASWCATCRKKCSSWWSPTTRRPWRMPTSCAASPCASPACRGWCRWIWPRRRNWPEWLPSGRAPGVAVSCGLIKCVRERRSHHADDLAHHHRRHRRGDPGRDLLLRPPAPAGAGPAFRFQEGGRRARRTCDGRNRGYARGHRGKRCSARSEEHTSELQSPLNLVCRLLLEKKKTTVDRCHARRSKELVMRTG